MYETLWKYSGLALQSLDKSTQNTTRISKLCDLIQYSSLGLIILFTLQITETIIEEDKIYLLNLPNAPLEKIIS